MEFTGRLRGLSDFLEGFSTSSIRSGLGLIGCGEKPRFRVYRV